MRATQVIYRTIAIPAMAVLALSACGANDDPADSGLPSLTTDDATDAGTGNAGSPDAGAPEGSAERDPELAMAEFEKCMKDAGIDVQVGEVGEGGASMGSESFESQAPDRSSASPNEASVEEFEAAAAECEQLLDGAFGTLEDLSPEERAEMADQQLRFERCMADNGFEIDSDDNGAFSLGPDIDFEEFEAAAAACGTESSDGGEQE